MAIKQGLIQMGHQKLPTAGGIVRDTRWNAARNAVRGIALIPHDITVGAVISKAHHRGAGSVTADVYDLNAVGHGTATVKRYRFGGGQIFLPLTSASFCIYTVAFLK